MRPTTPIRPFVVTLALAVVLLASAHTAPARAAAPSLTVTGETTARCAASGKPAAAGHQGKPFDVEGQGFDSGEALEVWFTFPDGRVYSPSVASFEASLEQPGLDGLLDLTQDEGYIAEAEDDGTYFSPFPTTFKWPYGCYTITFKRADDQHLVSAPFVIVPERIVTSPGPAKLAVQNPATRGAGGPQGTEVSITGNGFVANTEVALEVIQPNGTVLYLPNETASERGGFQATYLLDTSHRIGQYTFIATGVGSDAAPDNATPGRRVAASFKLTAKALPQMGRLTLRVSDPSKAIVAQEQEFQIQGQRFSPEDAIAVGLVLPSGAIVQAPNLLNDELNDSGSFFANLSLTRQLPTGLYKLIAQQGDNRAIASLKLTAGAP